ncbi:MAG: DegV family EDD domain-containing protein [Chloroflexi bacterium]|jgi:DegV family protein with EDD domain|nr:DegV family EDD domain-containing protein [Chloroflexota bacterium]
MKRKVAIVTDSTANMPENLLQEYNIQVIPLTVNWEGESLLDGVDIQVDPFYQRLQSAKEMPTTSQPSVGQFMEFFQEVAETAESIVGIFISEPLSGTMDSARAARQELSDLAIELVDSRSTAMGLALIVSHAARMAADGKDHQEIAEKCRAIVPNMRLLFVVDTLEFLHRGGRIGGAQRLVGSVLSIKPILHLVDGRIESLASVRTRRKAVNRLMEIIGEESGWKPDVHYGVLDAVAPKTGNKIFEQIKQQGQPVELLRSGISPVIGTHVGPGAVGVAFYDASSLE